MTFAHQRWPNERAGERRLLYRGGAEHRVAALETAEQGGAPVTRKSPQEELRSQTEEVAKNLEKKCIGWFNGLAIDSHHDARVQIRKAARERLSQASEKWNGWLYSIMHAGERRLLLAEARYRVVQDLITHFEGRKGEILMRRERFGRAAKFLRGWTGKAVSAAELKRKQNLTLMLTGMRGGYEKQAKKAAPGLEHLREANETAEYLRTELLEAGLPAEQLLPLFEAGPSRLDDLKREIAKIADPEKRASLLRAVRKLKWYGGRYQLLSALEQDPNMLPERQKLQAIDKDGMRGRVIDVDVGSHHVKTVVVAHSTPLLTLRDVTKGRGEQDAFLVLDANEGKLLMRQSGRLVEHDLLHHKHNRIHIPFASASGASALTA